MILGTFVVAVVIFLHIYFLVLEMFLWTKPVGLRIFKNSLTFAQESKVLAANQGLYNGFLAAGLLWALFNTDPYSSFQTKLFFLSCIVIAAIYGGFSVSRRIFYVQGVPALLGIILTWIYRQ